MLFSYRTNVFIELSFLFYNIFQLLNDFTDGLENTEANDDIDTTENVVIFEINREMEMVDYYEHKFDCKIKIFN